MEHYVGVDVSLEQSSLCVVDVHGRIVREAKVASEPEALVIFFQELGAPLTRIGLEAGPLSQWLHAGLTRAGFDVVLLAASPSCSGWAGSGRFTASRCRPKRSARCWSGASSCRANFWISNSASVACCAASGSRLAR